MVGPVSRARSALQMLHYLAVDRPRQRADAARVAHHADVDRRDLARHQRARREPALHRIPRDLAYARDRLQHERLDERAQRGRGLAGAGRVHVEQRVRRVENRDALFIHQPEIQRVPSVRRQ